MAKTLKEFLDSTAANDAAIFRHLVASSANGQMTMHYLEQSITNLRKDQKIATHVINRAARMGWCMAGEASAQLPREAKDRHPDIPWGALRELRDLYTHRGEKILSNPEKYKTRTMHLIGRIATTPNLSTILENAVQQETGQTKLELQYIQRGLRYGMALQLIASGQPEFTVISDRDPRLTKIANGMHCPVVYLPILITSGCGRMTVLETGDFLNATSLFLESMNVSRIIPASMRSLRNKVAHFKDFRKTNDGHTDMADTHQLYTAIGILSKLTKALEQEFKHSKFTFDPAPISKAYYNKLTKRLKPEAIAYLDTVVEKITSTDSNNPRLEQATIVAASNLLAEQPLEQASFTIEAVLNNRTAMMKRDEENNLYPASFALSHSIRDLMTDIQQRCTRNHETALI